MTPVAPVYRKMPGLSLTLTGRARIWMGDDHLLEVISNVVLERYRRYFFQDTLAFVLQRTKTRMAWAWVQGSIGFISLLVAGGAGWFGRAGASEDWHIAVYIFAGIAGVAAVVFLTLLVINLLLGPSCQCHVLTSTGWHALAAPARLGPAQRLQEWITPLIEAAQSELPAPDAGIE